MKALITTIIILVLFISSPFSVNAQNQDFSMELQNSTVHNAVLFPNPVADYRFNIQSNQVISKIEVLNVIGKTIHKQANDSYSTDDMIVFLPECEKGMYLVKIVFNDDKHIIKKLLIK